MVDLEEEGSKISLTIVDTPGFGDSIDNEFCFKEILQYVEQQYDDILAEESRIKRNPKFRDNRVHVLLYFITPTGHAYVSFFLFISNGMVSLREIDIEFMKILGPRVNIIPVIGRADSLTRDELIAFKKRVNEDIDFYQIPIYNFPYDPDEDDADTIEENNELRSLMPFAIIGGDRTRPDGSLIRSYPWGDAIVDEASHCDVSRLRFALLISHLNDMKEITHDFLYENYRTEKLSREHPDDMGDDGEDGQARVAEDDLKIEEAKLREKEKMVQREIAERRKELLAKEEALRSLEAKLAPA